MQFLALLTLALPALAAPVSESSSSSSSLIEKRAPSVNCGGKSYSSSLVNRCVNNSDNDAAPSTTYPHQYNDYEGFDFSDYCSSSTFYEYPLTSSGYTGGSPGPDRCITGSNGEFCGAITHTGTFLSSMLYCGDNMSHRGTCSWLLTGASGNNFVQVCIPKVPPTWSELLITHPLTVRLLSIKQPTTA